MYSVDYWHQSSSSQHWHIACKESWSCVDTFEIQEHSSVNRSCFRPWHFLSCLGFLHILVAIRCLHRTIASVIWWWWYFSVLLIGTLIFGLKYYLIVLLAFQLVISRNNTVSSYISPWYSQWLLDCKFEDNLLVTQLWLCMQHVTVYMPINIKCILRPVGIHTKYWDTWQKK